MPTSPGTKARPNANYILAIMRDDDLSDPWGTAMAWQFAVCENLAAAGSEVPWALGFSTGAGGPCLESYEDQAVWEYLTDTEGDPEARLAEVERAGEMLRRYIAWCVTAGRDY